jgi:hypothetical protein
VSRRNNWRSGHIELDIASLGVGQNPAVTIPEHGRRQTNLPAAKSAIGRVLLHESLFVTSSVLRSALSSRGITLRPPVQPGLAYVSTSRIRGNAVNYLAHLRSLAMQQGMDDVADPFKSVPMTTTGWKLQQTAARNSAKPTYRLAALLPLTPELVTERTLTQGQPGWVRMSALSTYSTYHPLELGTIDEPLSARRGLTTVGSRLPMPVELEFGELTIINTEVQAA